MSLLIGGSVTAAHLCHGKFEHGAIDGLSCSSSAQRVRPFFGAPFTGQASSAATAGPPSTAGIHAAVWTTGLPLRATAVTMVPKIEPTTTVYPTHRSIC